TIAKRASALRTHKTRLSMYLRLQNRSQQKASQWPPEQRPLQESHDEERPLPLVLLPPSPALAEDRPFLARSAQSGADHPRSGWTTRAQHRGFRFLELHD